MGRLSLLTAAAIALLACCVAAVQADVCICVGKQSWYCGQSGSCGIGPKFISLGAPLHHALASGNLAAAKQAIANGSDVNTPAEGWSPLHVALMTTWGGNRGNIYSDETYEALYYLLEKGANPNTPFPTYYEVPDATTPLSWAAYDGRAALVAKMIKAGGNVKSALKDSKRTPLHQAAICNPPNR